MDQIGVGIVGYGWAAGAHIDAINAIPGARVTALFSTRRLEPDALSARHGGPIRLCRTYRALLEDASVNVVSICSKPPLHAPQAIAAARAGKHLIIEKPLALTAAECAAIETAVASAGVRVCVCFECRFAGQFQASRALVDQGLLGDVHYGEADYYHGIGPWYRQYEWNVKKRFGGSSLLSAGCHALDALLYLMGGEVREVMSYATASSHPDFRKYEYPTTSVTILRFADGRVGKVASCIDCQQPYYFHVHLVGSEGSLLDNRFHSARLHGVSKQGWSTLNMPMVDSGDVKDHPYRSQFETFFACLRAGKDMPLTDLKTALVTHRVIFAADRSVATGKPVALVPDRRKPSR